MKKFIFCFFLLLGIIFNLKAFLSVGLIILLLNLKNYNTKTIILDIIIIFLGVYLLKVALFIQTECIIYIIDKYISIGLSFVTIYIGLKNLKKIEKKY